MRLTSARSGLLLVLDIVGLIIVYNLAHKARLGTWVGFTSVYLWLLIAAAVLTLYVMDVYRFDNSRSMEQLPVDTFSAVLVVAVSGIVITYVVGVEKFTSIFGRGVLPVAMVMFAAWAPACRWLFLKWYSKTNQVVNWLVICDQKDFEIFEEDNKAALPGFRATRMAPGCSSDEIETWLNGKPSQSGVIFETDARFGEGLANLLKIVSLKAIPVLTMTEFYENYRLKLPVHNLEEGWFIRNRGFNLLHDHIGIRLKRLADVLLAVSGLVLAIPIFIVVALMVRIDSPGSILYRQKRVGHNGKIFTLYKFRSMVEDAEEVGAKWSEVGDPRVTRVGRILRPTRLDELPQLWNLVRGDMSLIGPRPERPEFIDRLKQEIPYYDIRHLVPPGLTGWAQVMYSYGSSVKDARIKLEYDLYYIKNHSVMLDLSILTRTIAVILRGGGR